MEELTKFHVDWKKIVVVALLIVLTGLTTGGLTWYVADSGRDAELDAKDQTISDLETKLKKLEGSEATEETDAKSYVYQNTEYGFSLNLNEKWDGYKVFTKKGSEGTYFYFSVADDSVKVTDGTVPAGYYSLFAVSAYTPAQWTAGQGTPLFPNESLAENTKYKFSGVVGNGGPNNDSQKPLWDEADDILKTLKAL